ncbi:hypothetical protein BpHYR1_039734 [Brachionus plicatilis]|uniref:Uncharacterized protein n=1 Tax=Brachionus plicatilis TaxID=10195 RepID=A0A3M7T6I5_BRAPC|nr:hypothetical protein BpHYR1_039734 [Brachionus plicatilis]
MSFLELTNFQILQNFRPLGLNYNPAKLNQLYVKFRAFIKLERYAKLQIIVCIVYLPFFYQSFVKKLFMFKITISRFLLEI